MSKWEIVEITLKKNFYIDDWQFFSKEAFAIIVQLFNTLRPRLDGRHFPENIFKSIFFNENAYIWIKISLNSVTKGQINNILALLQKMAWHRPGNKQLSEPVLVSLLTLMCHLASMS